MRRNILEWFRMKRNVNSWDYIAFEHNFVFFIFCHYIAEFFLIQVLKLIEKR